MELPVLLQVDATWRPAIPKPKVLAVDTETRGRMFYPDFQVICVSWAFAGEPGQPRTGYVALYADVPPIVWEWLRDPEVLKTGHNIKYDVKALSLMAAGRPVYLWPFFDTRHSWGLIDETAVDEDRAAGKNYATIYPSLKVLARRAGMFRWTAPQERFLQEGHRFDEQPMDMLLAYAACDAVAQLVTYERAAQDLGVDDLNHLKFLMQVERALVDMEWAGLALDTERLRREIESHGALVAEHQQQLVRMAETQGVQLTSLSSSSPQLRRLLYETCECPVLEKKNSKRKTSTPSTDKATLQELAKHPETSDFAKTFITRLLEMRRAEAVVRQCKGYLDVVCPDGRIHAEFNLSGTRTGRLSSRPNVQNPSRTGPVRSCFVSRFDREEA